MTTKANNPVLDLTTPPVSGAVMSSLGTGLNMSFSKLFGVPTPLNADDAASKNYVDTRELDDLADVTAASPLTSDILRFNGTQWVNDVASRKNAIINGNFHIAQRGVAFPAFAGGYHLDRWAYGKSSAAAHTISRSPDTPTVVQANRLFTNSIQLALTAADTSIAATDFVVVLQNVEGANFIPLAQRPMVLSFWVKAGIAGIYCVAFRNSGSDRSYVAEYTVNAINTWEYKTIQVSSSPALGTWDYGIGTGITVIFTLACGTTFQAAPNIWQTGNFIATSNQVNGVNTGAGNFLLTAIQLESGNIATQYEAIIHSEELAMCQRYYEQGAYQESVQQNNVAFAEMYTNEQWVPYMVQKRILATVVHNIISGGGTGLSAANPPFINSSNHNGFAIQYACNAAGCAGDAILTTSGPPWTADAEL